MTLEYSSIRMTTMPSAIAIARVMEDVVFADTLRRSGASRAATFTWERTARATLDVYRELPG